MLKVKLSRLVVSLKNVKCLIVFKYLTVLSLQVLKGVPDRPEVALVKLREIKYKIDRRHNAQDRSKNTISVKDIVRILEGPCKVRPQFKLESYFVELFFFYFKCGLSRFE